MIQKITRINPDQLHTPPGYHHITVVEAGRTAFLAGQCPIDGAGALVGDGDINAQTDQVVTNAMIALDAVGAGPSDVVRTVIYVVSADTSVLGAAWKRLTQSPLGPAFTTASTLLGVARLGFLGQLSRAHRFGSGVRESRRLPLLLGGHVSADTSKMISRPSSSSHCSPTSVKP